MIHKEDDKQSPRLNVSAMIQSAFAIAVVSALLYFVGLTYNQGYYDAFGIDINSLVLTESSHFLATQLFLLVSIIISIVALPTSLLFWWLVRKIKHEIRPFFLITLLPILFFVGTIFHGRGMYTDNVIILGIGFCLLCITVVVYSLAVHEDGTRAFFSYFHNKGWSPVAVKAFGILLALSILSDISVISPSLGRTAARMEMGEIEGSIFVPPDAYESPSSKVNLFSLQPLSIPEPTLIAPMLNEPGLFKYDDLRLIIHSGNYFYVYRTREIEGNRPLVYAVPDSSLWQVELQKAATVTPSPTTIPTSIATQSKLVPTGTQ